MLLAMFLLVAIIDEGPSESIERDSVPHFAVAAGAGLAYSYVGAHAELRWREVSLFISGTPFPSLGANRPLTTNESLFGAGIRLTPRGREGWFVSAQATWCRFQYHLDTGYLGSSLDNGRHDTYTATIGWRSRVSMLFFDVAVGGGLDHDWNHHGGGLNSIPGPLSNPTSLIFDGQVSAGFEL